MIAALPPCRAGLCGIVLGTNVKMATKYMHCNILWGPKDSPASIILCPIYRLQYGNICPENYPTFFVDFSKNYEWA